MSAFLCSNLVISRVVNAFQNVDAEGNAALAKLVVEAQTTPRVLFDRLRRMNLKAIKVRYGASAWATEGTPSPFYIPAAGSRHGSGQTFRSIACFLYQCSEGKVASSPLFKATEKVQLSLGMALAYQHPDVINSTWG